MSKVSSSLIDKKENVEVKRSSNTENNGVVNIAVESIYQHPDNPRKDLGDLTELSESVKKNGVLQNLTVIPIEGQPGEYYALIGNRRHGAAKLAGLAELPCKIIEGMSKKDQISTMLEENMQRNDLTIWEQANGFQMMLDLGDTEDQIAEKTGFSKTTIRRRLNIAKLDQKELKKKEQDGNFQLTLKDLYELEKVADIKTRNKILKEANSSRDLVSRSQNAVAEAKRDANAKTISGMLKKQGVEKAPKEAENEVYSGKWKVVKEFELDKDAPKQVKLPKENEQMYWFVIWRSLRVIVKAPKGKRELSKWELEQQARDKTKKQIKAVLRESTARRKEFIENIISEKIDPVKDEEKVMNVIWKAMLALGTGLYESTMRRFFLSKDEYKCSEDEKLAAKEKVESLSTLHQMMIILHTAMESTNETYDYNGKFYKTRGDALLKGYEALEPYGWYFENEAEEKVLDGTHELYKKEEQK